jgi:hypothetical protein
MPMLRVIVVGLGLCAGSGIAQAQTALPRQNAVLILIPGAGGIHPKDFLVITRGLYEAAGFTVEMTTSAWQAQSLVSSYKSQGRAVTLVGMSLGGVTAAQAIAAGANPDKVVFAASGLMPPGTPNGSVMEALGDPARLPRTLVLHHRGDECRMTLPDAVQPFVRWARGRANVRWITGGGGPGLPCRPDTPHTFTGRERAAASAIISFARGR